MEIERKALLDKLGLVSPALSNHDLIPVLRHFCFDGEAVTAYNDAIGITVECKTEFTGAVPGPVLEAFIRASGARSVKLTHEDGNLKIKAAGATINLGMMPPEDFVFEMPVPTPDKVLPVKSVPAFRVALDGCLRSIGTDTSQPDQLGVTLIPDGAGIELFATNNSTLSHARVALTKECPFKKRVILPADFVRQMLRFNPVDAKKMHLEIHADHALFNSVGGVELFGRYVLTDQPVDVDRIMNHHLPEGVRKKLVPLPTKLKNILLRAMVVTESQADQGSMTIAVDGDMMRFTSKTARGEVIDLMKVEKHPPVSARFEPRYLRNGMGAFDKWLVTKSCVVMERDGTTYLVAALA
jgi:DNA polymerase III sliding clamp (beta) subunit (PCNA family)